jgi:hypothetical protein
MRSRRRRDGSRVRCRGSRSRHINIGIDRPAGEVYDFAADPRNLPQWAAGLAGSRVEHDGAHWFTESPMGRWFRGSVRWSARHAHGGVMASVPTAVCGDDRSAEIRASVAAPQSGRVRSGHLASTTDLSVARSFATASASRLKSLSVISGRWRMVKTTSHPSPSLMTRSGL